ncbi:MAG: VOC family protein [Chloroflexi bacterium]|nr:VOC family protein [Chloroflexota bacterium]
MANHPIVHLDIPAQDPVAAAKFYEQALGWQLTHDSNFDYWMFSAEGGPGGGFVGTGHMGGKDTHPQYEIGKVLVYLGSDDIDADLARVEAGGGRVLMPRASLGDFGAWAVFADPSGNQIGFFQSLTPAE